MLKAKITTDSEPLQGERLIRSNKPHIGIDIEIKLLKILKTNYTNGN